MRVIKCGDGYSGLVQCNVCKSELEYYRNDVSTNECWVEMSDKQQAYDVGVLLREIRCPVCGNPIELDAKYYFAPKNSLNTENEFTPSLKSLFGYE